MRINFGVWTLILSMISVGAFAQDYRYDIYLDSDANAGTGCSVVTPAGTVAGVEARVRADITNVTVTGSTVALCQGGSFPAGGNLPAPYAVGLNNGTAGSDVIEMATPATLAPAGANVPVHVVGWNGAATASDILSTTNGLVGGPPIIVGFPVVNIPTLGLFGFGLMILVLAVFGLKRLRTAARASLAAIGLLSVAGAVWAAGFSADGQVVDWNGVNPIATDPAADGSTGDTGIDLRALYVGFENGTMFVRIDVTDVENQPPVANPVALTLLEDAAPQVITLSATDADGDPLTFAVQTNPTRGTVGAVTPVNTTSANVTYTVTPNANGADSFTYVANDGFVNSAPATVSLTITPVNDAPVFTAQNPPAVLEDSGAQTATVAAGLAAGPADESGQTIAFTITNNTNAALFTAPPTISPTGVLSYTPAPNANGTAQITFTAQDNGGTANGGVDTSAPATVTVTVTAVNDAPVFTPGANQTVLEDAGATTVAGWATGISPGPADEAGQVLTFNITANTNAALFSTAPAVNPANGNLTFTPAANANGSATITVALSDNGGTANGGVDTSVAQTFTITVTAVNDAPAFTSGGNVTVLKDIGPSTFPGWATGISAGPVDEAGQVLTFEVVNNTNAALFSTAPAVNATNGNLTFTVAANANGTATITLRLRDNGGTTNGGVDVSANQLFDIIVTAVNDQPTFTPGANQTVNEDSGPQIAAGWATAISAGPPDEIGQVLTFNVTNNTNPTLFSTGPAVNPTTGNLTYTPAANANGVATITLTLSDNGGTANGGIDTSAPATFTITVTAVNDAPSFTAQNPPTVDEDAGPQNATVATAISTGPADEAGQTVSFAITGNTNPGLFNGTPTISSAGSLSYTPAANQSGSATLTITAQDNGGTANGGIDSSAPQNVTVTVTAVNDMPTLTVAGPQTTTEDTPINIPSAVSVGDIDLGGGNIEMSFIASTGTLSLAGTTGLGFTVGDGTNDTTMTFTGNLASINAAVGTLTFTPGLNYAGPVSITVSANDLGNTGSGGPQTNTQGIGVTVNAVNDAPVVTVPAAQNVGTGAVLAFSTPNGNAVSVADPDSAAAPINVTVGTTIGTLSATSVGGVTIGGNNTASLSLTGDVGNVATTLQSLLFTSAVGGTGTITVTANDNGNTGAGGVLTDTESFAISVDSAPTVTATAPTNGATVANNVALSITFSEVVDVNTNGVTLVCSGGPVALTGGSSGTNVSGLVPTYAGTLPAGNCTMTVVAAQVTDDDTIDPPNGMVADHVVTFTVDAAPAVATVVPASGATNIGTNTTITVTFNESVDIASPAAFALECPTPTAVPFTVTTPATLPASATTFVITPTGALPGGVTCTFRVNAANVADTDVADPPQNMLANFTSTFSTDAAPTVTGGAPAAGATGVATTTTVTYTFSENVDAGPGAAIALECPAGNPIAGTISGSGTSTLTFTPSAALPVATLCSATTVAANIRDSDTFDPPDLLATDVVRTFTTDAPPTVTSTNPANAASGVPGSNTITINFSEPVTFDTTANAANTSFDLECPTPTPANFTVVTASPAASVVLDPADAAIAGQTCTLTVRALGIADADLGDPPNNMLLDFSASFAFAGVANDDAYTVTPHLTFAAPTSVTANDVLGAETITGFGSTLATANGTVPNGTNFVTGSGAGGRIILQANGTFTFFPDAADDNIDGTVSFFYTLSGGDTAQVTLTFEAEEFVWFIDATPASLNCTGSNLGTQACPADEYVDFSAIDTANDVIFIDSGNYAGSITLENTEMVIGNGATSTLTALVSGRVSPVAGSTFAPYDALNGAAPVLSCTNVTCVTLGNGNTLRGFEIGNSGINGTDLSGTNFGTLTVDEVTLSGSGRALNLVTGTVAGSGFLAVTSGGSSAEGVSLNGIAGTLGMGATTVSGAGTQGISVVASTATVNFGNTSVAGIGGNCVQLTGNSAGSRNFGTLTLSSCVGIGFSHNIGGGAVTVTGGTTMTNMSSVGVSIDGNTTALTFNGILINKAATAGGGMIVTNSSGPIATGVLLVTLGGGTGLTYSTSSGGLTIAPTSSIVTNAGPAIVSNGGQGWDAQFATLSAVSSPTQGLNLVNISGTITAAGGAITATTGVAFLASGTLGTVNYAGPISKTTAGDLINIGAGATGNVTLSGQLTCNTACTGIDVAGRTGGITTFSGASSAISTGGNIAVNLTGNGGGAVNFTGGNLSLVTTTGVGFNATGGGIVTVTGTGNRINTNGGIAVNVVNTAIGVGGLVFQSINTTGAASAIVLNTTGALGGLSVTGTGTAGSGGTLNNQSGNAISLTSTSNVVLDRMVISNSGDSAIRGTQVNNFSLSNSSLSNIGNADNENAIDFAAVGAQNITGTLTLNTITINNFQENGVAVNNNTGAVTVNVTNGTISNNSGTFGQSGLLLESANTAGLVANITGTTFTSIEGGAINYIADGTGTHDLNVTSITSNSPGGADNFPLNPIVTVVGRDQNTVPFDVNSNTFNDVIGDGVVVVGDGNMQGRVNNNVMDGDAASISADPNLFGVGDGIRYDMDGVFGDVINSANFTWTVLATGNTIAIGENADAEGDDGIQVLSRDHVGTFNGNFRSNTIQHMFSEGIRFFAGERGAPVLGDTNNLIEVSNNPHTNTGVGTGEFDFVLRTTDSAIACFDLASNSRTTTPLEIQFEETETSDIRVTQNSAGNLAAQNGGATVTVAGTAVTFNQACNPPDPTNP